MLELLQSNVVLRQVLGLLSTDRRERAEPEDSGFAAVTPLRAQVFFSDAPFF